MFIRYSRGLVLIAATAVISGCSSQQKPPASAAEAAAVTAKTTQTGTQAIQNDSQIPGRLKAGLIAHYNSPPPVHAQ